MRYIGIKFIISFPINTVMNNINMKIIENSVSKSLKKVILKNNDFIFFEYIMWY
jgi:hypothetical protein